MHLVSPKDASLNSYRQQLQYCWWNFLNKYETSLHDGIEPPRFLWLPSTKLARNQLRGLKFPKGLLRNSIRSLLWLWSWPGGSNSDCVVSHFRCCFVSWVCQLIWKEFIQENASLKCMRACHFCSLHFTYNNISSLQFRPLMCDGSLATVRKKLLLENKLKTIK